MQVDSDWTTGKPLVIAHRGASGQAPENTMAAFRLAAKQGADAIELDAKLSADGVIVIHHDATLDRTTSGSGPLNKQTWNELKSLDAGSSFCEHFAGEPIPQLRQVLEELGDTLLINIELTNYARPWDTLPEEAVKLVKDMGLERRVLFSSFNPVALTKVRKLGARIPSGLLLLPQEPAWIRGLLRRVVAHDALHLQERLVDGRIVEAAHESGRLVNVWTVNDPKRMGALLDLKVDGLITDYPETAIEVIDGSR